MQKSVAFLYANNELTEEEILKKYPIQNFFKKNKIPRNKLNQECKNKTYWENYKKLKKEIKEDTSKWKHIPCSWIKRITIIKMSLLPKAIYRFDAIPIKMTMAYFTDLEQIFQNFIWNQK